jgi:hypothetical protein
MPKRNHVCRYILAACLIATVGNASAASGELGTGVPQFGSYSAATGMHTRVWRLDDATLPFPAGCTSLQLTPTTMGTDSYKIAVATMLSAKLTNRKVRFYSHAPRDTDGCGVDYVELFN